MSTVRTADSTSFRGVFGDTEQLVRELGTLDRLVRTDRLLPSSGADRTSAIVRTTALWERFRPSTEDVRERFLSLREEFERAGSLQLFEQLYSPAISKIQTLEGLNEAVNNFAKDLLSTQISPLRQAARGLEGPTFLVRFLRNGSIRSSVIKWTYPIDLPSHRVYEFLAGRSNLGFSVPQAAAITLGLEESGGEHELPNGAIRPIDREAFASLTELLTSLKRTARTDVEISPTDLSPVMIYTMVKGSDLADFFQHQYDGLSQGQKEHFFRSLGKLAMFDLFMGHDDRLIGVSRNSVSREYEFSEEATNLGNAMVSIPAPGALPTLYAIDNGLNDELFKSPRSQAYDLFIRTHVLHSGDQDTSAVLAQHLREDLMAGIVSCERIPNRIKDLIRSDLEQFGTASASEGLREMGRNLKTDVRAAWNSEAGTQFKDYLRRPPLDFRSCSQEFLEYMENRFNALTQEERG